MKVRLLTCLSGARGVFNSGDEYECDGDEASRLIEKGLAEPIREQRVETTRQTTRKQPRRKASR